MTSSHDPSGLTRSTKVIAVVDVVESVRLMEQDEQRFILRWQRFVGFVQQRLPKDAGRLHKSLGDGLMLEFADPHPCIEALRAMREWFATGNLGLPPEDQVHLRIGVHRADFVVDAHDIYGTDVNLAARIASLAGPGEIVVSGALRRHLDPDLQAQLEDLGTCHLKHAREPVHVYRLGEAGPAPVLAVRRLASHTLRPTLAVLPFGADTADAAARMGRALADDVVAGLSQSELLQVVSRLSALPFGDRKVNTLEEVRRVLGAHYALTGRALGEGEQVSLFIELVDTLSGHAVWARSFRMPLRPEEPAESKLLRELVAAVHSAVIGAELQRSRAQPLLALEGFTLLLSSIALMHWLSSADMQRAQAMLEHLGERAPGHAAPHAWLAHLHLLRLRQHGAPAWTTEVRLARQQATAAVQCEAVSPLALAVQGEVCLFAAQHFARAQECYHRAQAGRPDDSFVQLLQSELHALTGKGPAAQACIERARAAGPLEPLRFLYDATAALAAVASGDLVQACQDATRALESNPAYLPAWRTLLLAHALQGDHDQARDDLERLCERQPRFSMQVFSATTPAAPAVGARWAAALRAAGVPEH